MRDSTGPGRCLWRALGLALVLAILVGAAAAGSASPRGEVLPDLTITKTALGTPWLVGGTETFTLDVKNLGPGAVPGGTLVFASENLSAGLTELTAVGTGWLCPQNVVGPAGVVCQYVVPAAGLGTASLPTITFTVQVTSAPSSGQLNNCAGTAAQETPVGGTIPEVTQANNQSCVDIPTVRPGRLCVLKFEDKNGDGVQNGPGEPLVAGWTFTVKDATGNAVGTLTSSTVPVPVCMVKLKPGTYTVVETPQPGWTPTAPTSGQQSAIVVAGQATTVKFGNRKKLKPQPCCLTFVLQAGKNDSFGVADGATAEPATPPPGKPQTYFDQAIVPPKSALNQAFWHRFTLPLGNCVKSGSLQIRLRALNDIPANDAVRLQVGGSFWQRPVNSLSPPWTIGKTVTFGWNLGSLPGGGDLRPALNAQRFLDIILQDDSSVDFARLTVTFCKCKGGPPPSSE